MYSIAKKVTPKSAESRNSVKKCRKLLESCGDLGMHKGAVYENIIADAFSKRGRSLFYFHKDSGLEIDFITPIDAEVTLVEAKATNGNAKSANTVLKNKDRYGVNRCIKLSSNNVGQVGEKLTLPYYMVFLLK